MANLKVGSNFQYSENNKKEGTKAVLLKYAGFSLSNKLAFYIEGSKDMYYTSLSVFKNGLNTGLIKELK